MCLGPTTVSPSSVHHGMLLFSLGCIKQYFAYFCPFSELIIPGWIRKKDLWASIWQTEDNIICFLHGREGLTISVLVKLPSSLWCSILEWCYSRRWPQFSSLHIYLYLWSQRLFQFHTLFFFCTIYVCFWTDMLCVYFAACGWHIAVHCRFYSERWRRWSCLQVVAPPLFWFDIRATTMLRLSLSIFFFFCSWHWQNSFFFLLLDLLTV